MSLQWDKFEEWYVDIRYSIKSAVDQLEARDEDGRNRKKGSALQLLMRDRSSQTFNHRTLANKLTPTSESHDLSFSEAWHILEITNDINSLMAICRHKNMLLTHYVGPMPVAEEVLVPVFTKMRKELSETQDLIGRALEEKLKTNSTVSLPTKGALKREVYEDLCAAMAMVTHLEAMITDGTQPVHIPGVKTRFRTLSDLIRSWAQDLEHDEEALSAFLERSQIRRGDFDRLTLVGDEDSSVSFKLFLKAAEADLSNELLLSFCQSLGYRIYPIKPSRISSNAKSVLEQFYELEEQQAGTLQRLNAALQDRKVTHKELTEITAQLEEEYGAELAILNAVLS